MAFETIDIKTLRNGGTPAVGYRDDLLVGEVVTFGLTSMNGVTTIRWDLLGRPEGAIAGGSVVPAVLGTGATVALTVDADNGAVLKDGTYKVQATINPGTPSETRKTVIVARLSGLFVPGDQAPLPLRMPGGFEALEDTSVPNRNQGWATQLNRWLRFLRIQSGGDEVFNQFGAEPLVNTDGFSLQADDGKWVDFTKFGPSVTAYLSFVGSMAAAPLPGGLSVWASTTERDTSAGGTLLVSKELPALGTFVSPEIDIVVPGTFIYNPGSSTKKIVALVTGVDLTPFTLAEFLQVVADVDWVSDAAWTAFSKFVQVYVGGSAQLVGVTQPPTTITGLNGGQFYDPGPALNQHTASDDSGGFVNPGGASVTLKIVVGTTNAVPVNVNNIRLKIRRFPPQPSNFQGFDAVATFANPGGKKYVTLTSFAGATGAEFPATSIPLSYFGARLVLKG